MTEPRTVTIPTLDHGHITIPCPDWCNGHHQDGGYSSDIGHESVQLCALIDTPCHGLVLALEANLAQNPLSTRPEITTNVMIDGDAHEFDPDGLRDLADTLVSHAGTLRGLADRLAGLLAAGER